MAEVHVGDWGSLGGDCLPLTYKAAGENSVYQGHPAVPFFPSKAGCRDKQIYPGPRWATDSLTHWFSAEDSQYSREVFLALWTHIIQEATKLGNAGNGKIDLKDLGRVMLLGNPLIFFFCMFFHWFQIKAKLPKRYIMYLLKLRNRLHKIICYERKICLFVECKHAPMYPAASCPFPRTPGSWELDPT